MGCSKDALLRLPSGTQAGRLLETSCTREDSERSTDREFHSLTTRSSRRNWDNSESSALRTSFMKLLPADPTSKRSTVSCGHSNSLPEEEELRRRASHTNKADAGATGRPKSTH